MGTKTSLKKSEVALLQTLSRLFHFFQFVKCLQLLLELNSKRLYHSSGKEKESRCLVFKSSTKREIRHFHVVVVQLQQRNVPKSVMHVQGFCFTNLNLLLFCCSGWSRRRRCFSYGQKDATLLANNSQYCWMLHVASFCTFGISREPRTSRSHVTRTRFTFVRLDYAPEVSVLPQGFFGP